MKVRAPWTVLLLGNFCLGLADHDAHAQEAPCVPGSLDSSFFPQNTVFPGWNGAPTIHRIFSQPDGAVLICGSFDHVQRHVRRGLARLQCNGTLDAGFAPGAGFIIDAAPLPDGKIIVAASYRGLARLNPDGTLDGSFDGTIPDGASAVAVLPSGEFLAAAHIDDDPATSAHRYGVLLVDAQGHLSQRWTSLYRSASPLSYILVAPDGTRAVVDGGVEISLGNSGANFRWLTNALPAELEVQCGAFQPDGKLLLGARAVPLGQPNTNATVPSALVRLNTDGSPDATFSANTSIGMGEMEGAREQLRVAAITVQADGKILVGGFFTRVQGEPRALVARLFSDGQLDPEFATELEVSPGSDIDAQQCVSAMALDAQGSLLIGGVLSRCNGLECQALVRLHTENTHSGGILAFSQPNYYVGETNVLLQVEVVRYGPCERAVSVCYELTAPSSDFVLPTPTRGTLIFAPGEDRKQITLSAPDNLIAEGNRSFHIQLSNPTGGAVLTRTPETRIVILDDEVAGRPGTVDLTFPALILGGLMYNATVLAVEPDGSALIAAQVATNYSSYVPLLLRLKPTGEIDTSFQAVLDQTVEQAFPDPVSGKILIVGNFSIVDGQERSQIARLNHDGSLDESFLVTTDNWISGADVGPDGHILLYGYFNQVNQVPRRQVAKLNQDGTVDLNFDTSGLSWLGGLCCAACQADGKVVIGGYFEGPNGSRQTNLARLNSDGSWDPDFAPLALGHNSWIQSVLCQPDGNLLIGGSIQLPDGGWQVVLRLNEDGSRDPGFNADLPPQVQGWPALLLQPDGKIVVAGKWRLNPDGSRDGGFFTGDDSASVYRAALLPNGDLLVSGSFSTFEEWPRPCLVRLHGGDVSGFGYFEFTTAWCSVSEADGAVVVHVRRGGPTDQPATVDVRTVGLTAQESIDYVGVAESLNFPPGVREQAVSIPILHRPGYQGDRAFEIHLQDQTGGIRAPSGLPTMLSITEADPGLTLSQTSYWIAQETIATNGYDTPVGSVQRHGDLSSALTVHCRLDSGTAQPGKDFVATNLTLSFLPQQSEIAVVAPLLRNESAVEDRTLYLVLNDPTPDISLATGSTATLTITGLQRPPALVPGGITLCSNGSALVQCDIWPGQYLVVESSTDLLNWTTLTWTYRWPNEPPPSFEDPQAWKYSQRFYRIPLSQSDD